LVVVATDVDHIVPHKNDMTLFWDKANWQSLCGPCHSTKTAGEDGGFGNLRR
jgi:5-methylcytosine-specific restriction protein A